MLQAPYDAAHARLVIREMTDALALDLVEKGLVTDQVALTVGYDRESLTDPARRAAYHGPIENDGYGRMVPKAAHGSLPLGDYTSSARWLISAVTALFDRIVDPNLLVRRMYVVVCRVLPEEDVQENVPEQLNMFMDYAAEQRRRTIEAAAREKERRQQRAVLDIKKRFGKNAILKGMSYLEGATARQRNGQIGGHRA